MAEKKDITEDEIERLRKWVEAQHYDRLAIPFICGTSGEILSDHLPEKIMVCPAYGSDIVVMFGRAEKIAQLRAQVQELENDIEALERCIDYS